MSREIFIASIDAQYAQLGEAVTYRPAAGGSSTVRIIPNVNYASRSTSVGMIVQDDASFHVRSSDVAQPAVGDEIDYLGVTYRVRSQPRLGVMNLVWFLDAPPKVG